ncbi:MAG TPA: EAL domain-containing protein [Polyangiaceae bacterium]|nr:EAL domain-containing protein [Polyangiaceae bacterium]
MGDRPLAAAGTSPASTPPAPAAYIDDRVESCTKIRTNATRATGASHRARLLLVDDEPDVREILARQLRNQGYYVDIAASGQEAVAYVDQTSYDVIVSDVRMPSMDGIELLKVVRQHDLRVPVVLLTGAPALDGAVQALEFGAFHYLAKTAGMTELERVVDRAASWRRRKIPSDGSELRPSHAGATALALNASLTASLNRCLEGLWMAYHPIVDVSRQEVFGYEALMRSTEPALPHPALVFDAAKRLSRLDELGRITRSRAAEPFAQAAASSALLFVNLHVTDLDDPVLTDPSAPLSKIADRVVLEVTERSSLDEVKNTRSRVARLREMGFRIAMDDMGSGYAGLTSFALLEPDYVKLDMSLIRDVHLNPTQQKVIRSMTGLCRDLGMKVVAEGVETVDERDALIESGCELLQGFLFAKPGRAFPRVEW